MVALSLMIEGQNGLTWPRWKRIVADAEALGFAGLYRSDHYTNASPPEKESLEMVVSLAYAADHTSRLRFGPLVAPLTFREPTMLARQAAALDDLSGGRMILGLGAGWSAREHRMFGFDLGDTAPRMDRLAEGLDVITRLLRSDEPVTYEGSTFSYGRRSCCRGQRGRVGRAFSLEATARRECCRSPRAMPTCGTR
jgi:alkanesulfonate monooxygenase SsuD/methylene tetrahydromethanopterin reductase-like flavin-dependent oxidoreductase (luciferase family)